MQGGRERQQILRTMLQQRAAAVRSAQVLIILMLMHECLFKFLNFIKTKTFGRELTALDIN